jgi:hypothetical protein
VKIGACGRELGQRIEKVTGFYGSVLGEQIAQDWPKRKMGRRELSEPLIARLRRQVEGFIQKARECGPLIWRDTYDRPPSRARINHGKPSFRILREASAAVKDLNWACGCGRFFRPNT